jgi:hypothetical protein
MVVLAESGVKFGVIIHADGSRERWPKPAPQEVPRCDESSDGRHASDGRRVNPSERLKIRIARDGPPVPVPRS